METGLWRSTIVDRLFTFRRSTWIIFAAAAQCRLFVSRNILAQLGVPLLVGEVPVPYPDVADKRR